MLRSTGKTVNLKLIRYVHGLKFEQLQQAIAHSQTSSQVTTPSKVASPTPQSQATTQQQQQPTVVAQQQQAAAATQPANMIRTDSIISDAVPDLSSDSVVASASVREEEEDSKAKVEEDVASLYDGPLDEKTEVRLIEKWSALMGPTYKIIVAQLTKFKQTGGLGISLEGTVEKVDGEEQNPHHYIRSVLPNGPVGRNGRLQSGDELLEVNGRKLLGLYHTDVVGILKDLPVNVRIVCARSTSTSTAVGTSNNFGHGVGAGKQLGGVASSLMTATDRLVKAKSDGSISSTGTTTEASQQPGNNWTTFFPKSKTVIILFLISGSQQDKQGGQQQQSSKLKSRSLEPLTSLAMWSEEVLIIELVKGDRGLGFSILDYQDPMNKEETVIVIRSLVPGGVAQQDGRLVPGDRLMYVNEVHLEHASLDEAVQALKGASRGIVHIGVSKPLPVPDSSAASTADEEGDTTNTHNTASSEDNTEVRSEVSDLEERRNPAYLGTLPELPADDENSVKGQQQQQQQTGSERLLVTTRVEEKKKEEDMLPPLPTALERRIKLVKDSDTLGVQVDIEEEGINGLIVRSVAPGGTLATDGRIQPGDYLVSVNGESMRRISHSQALDILRRTHMIPLREEISLTYIPASDAAVFKASAITRLTTTASSSGGAGEVGAAKRGEKERKAPASSSKAAAAMEGEQQTSSSKTQVSEKANGTTVISIGGPPLSVPTDGRGGGEKASSYAPLVSPEASEIGFDKAGAPLPPPPPPPLQPDSPPPDSPLQIAQATVDESSTDDPPLPPPPPLQESQPPPPSAPPRPSKSASAGSSSASTPSHQGAGGAGAEDLATATVVVSNDRRPSPSPPVARGLSGGEDDDEHSALTSSNAFSSQHWGPERTVEIQRVQNQGLGISIVGGKVDQASAASGLPPDSSLTVTGIFIKNVLEGSPAGASGQLFTGDRILEVDGHDLRNASHDEAVDVIRQSGQSIRFVVQSLLGVTAAAHTTASNTTEEEEEDSAAADNMVVPPPEFANDSCSSASGSGSTSSGTGSGSSTGSSCSSDEEEGGEEEEEGESSTPTVPLLTGPQERGKKLSVETVTTDESESLGDLSGTVTLSNGNEIDRNSAGFLPLSKKDREEPDEYGYTIMKIQRKYAKFSHQPDGSRGTLIYACINKGTAGLGISLSGHKDRSKMSVYICGLNPLGNAHRDGRMKVGDLILEVNGRVLHDRHHLNVTSLIKGLPDSDVTFVLLRTDTGMEDLAVRPVSHFPPESYKENPIERYSGRYKGLREVVIQKGDQGLGIMIIEGKHPEAGTGVFVSDLQAGSCADDAGLRRGDMILAVNGEDFVGANYDTAAGVLKNSDGQIRLIVANPLQPAESVASIGSAAVSEAAAAVPSVTSPPPAAEKTEAEKKPDVAAPVAKAAPPSPEKPKLPPKPAIAPKPSGVSPTHKVPTSTSATTAATTDAKTTVQSKPPSSVTTTTTTSAAAKPASRPRPVASPRKKTPGAADAGDSSAQQHPSTCEIAPGANTTIEITKDKDEDGKTMGLGLSIVGGSDTLLGAIFIHEVYEKGAAHKDGRLRPGDQILEVMSENLRNVTHSHALHALRQTPNRVRLVIHRFVQLKKSF